MLTSNSSCCIATAPVLGVSTGALPVGCKLGLQKLAGRCKYSLHLCQLGREQLEPVEQETRQPLTQNF